MELDERVCHSSSPSSSLSSSRYSSPLLPSCKLMRLPSGPATGRGAVAGRTTGCGVREVAGSRGLGSRRSITACCGGAGAGLSRMWRMNAAERAWWCSRPATEVLASDHDGARVRHRMKRSLSLLN